jgi:hypothetical protein
MSVFSPPQRNPGCVREAVGDVLCRSLLFGNSLVEAVEGVEGLLDIKSRMRPKVKN